MSKQDFNEWKKGTETTTGSVISHIYYRKTDVYIIYLTDHSSLVSHKTNPDLELDLQLHSVQPKIARIQGLLEDHKSRERFLARIAYAKKLIFDNNIKEGEGIIDSVLNSVKKNLVTTGRMYYLLGNISFTLLLTIISILFNYVFSINSELLIQSNAMYLATLGCILSVMTNLKKIEIDVDIYQKTQYLFAGASRCIIAVISGLSIYFIIRSGLFSQKLFNITNEDTSFIYIFAIISGFSEKFITNLFKKLENKGSE